MTKAGRQPEIKRTWERILSDVKEVKDKPAAAVDAARAKKFQTYNPLLYVIKKQVLGASGWGKFKTVMQIVAICMVIAPFGFLGAWFGWLTQIVLWFTVALTVYTGVQYLVPKK